MSASLEDLLAMSLSVKVQLVLVTLEETLEETLEGTLEGTENGCCLSGPFQHPERA